MGVEMLECLRCGHRWRPRTEQPVTCPKCHSYKWQQAKETSR